MGISTVAMNEKDEVKYPYVGRSDDSTGSDVWILFVEKNRGVVVRSDSDMWPVGRFTGLASEDKFIPMDSVTVTFTKN